MNFDINTLSTLMQMMGSQKPRESEQHTNIGANYNANYNNYNYAGAKDPSQMAQNTSQSVFAMQNGLGQRVDIEPKTEKKSSSANPMSALFDMMSGGKGGSGDMMSSLMPMFMNMMSSKPAKVAGGSNNAKETNNDFEQKLKEAMDNASGNDSKQVDNGNNAKNVNNKNNENMQNRQSTQVKRDYPHDRYSPISFAGYALICSLHKLYMSKKYELR